MKNLIIFTLFALGAPNFAHAATSIDATGNVIMAKGTSPIISIGFTTPTAAKIFDGLTVEATPGWEDVSTLNKSAAGLYCMSNGNVDRYAECTIQVHALNGVVDAVPSGRGEKMTVSFSGSFAKKIYALLEVKEEQADRDGSAFLKRTSGFVCQRNSPEETYSCAVAIDSALGVLR